MKLLLDIPDDKVALMLQLLENLRFVNKAEALSPAQAKHIANLKEAVLEVSLVKRGRKKPVLLKDVLDEL